MMGFIYNGRDGRGRISEENEILKRNYFFRLPLGDEESEHMLDKNNLYYIQNHEGITVHFPAGYNFTKFLRVMLGTKAEFLSKNGTDKVTPVNDDDRKKIIEMCGNGKKDHLSMRFLDDIDYKIEGKKSKYC